MYSTIQPCLFDCYYIVRSIYLASFLPNHLSLGQGGVSLIPHPLAQVSVMDITNAKTRLRRTFHYPTDDSSNSATPDVLDEEGWSGLISQLQPLSMY